MVHGIFKHISFPIAYFPSNGFDSYQLYPCVWEAVRILESVGFKVRGLVSDGATPNRKFYRMHLHFEKDNQKEMVSHIGLGIDMLRIENFTFLVIHRT